MYEALPDLTELFPHATPEDVRDAEQRASDLLGAAFFAANLGKGAQYLKTAFPGFQDETYWMVYGLGSWLAR